MCVKGNESSLSLSLSGSQEFSPQIFPDDFLCADAGNTALSELHKDPSSIIRQVGTEPWVLRKRPERALGVCNREGPSGGNEGQEAPL